MNDPSESGVVFRWPDPMAKARWLIGVLESDSHFCDLPVRLSVEAVEAFLGDLGYIANSELALLAPSTFRELGAELTKPEIDLKGTRYRLALALDRLEHQPDEEDRRLLDDFDVLARLRNKLVHARPIKHSRGDSGLPEVVQHLREREVVPNAVSHGSSPWLELVQTRAVARWAYNTAGSVIELLIWSNPPGFIQDYLWQTMALNEFDALTVDDD